MRWSEIQLHTTNEAIEPITNRLHESDVSGVVIVDPLDIQYRQETGFGEIYELDPTHYPDEGVYVKFYLPTNKDLEQKLTHITTVINELASYDIDLGPNQLEIRELEEEDWATAWKKHYHTIHITDRITIKPTWEKYEQKSSDELVIDLDPGMAFGTGIHATTQLSIQALEKYIEKNDHIIDVGCGSGVLSIISARLGAKQILSLDLDEIAVKSTILNAELNNVHDQLDVRQNDLLKSIHHQANVIVSNILAEIIVQFPADVYNNLVNYGVFIASGIIEKKKELVVKHLQEAGFTILSTKTQSEWVSIVAQKT